MEASSLSPKPAIDYHSNVDSSRPFRSVKEAVAIFGERLLAGEITTPNPKTNYAPSPQASWKYSSPSPRNVPKENTAEVVDTLKKLEAELKETKMELKHLKERESETEIALATLNAELHKNMSKLAEAEAAAAKRAAATRTVSFHVGNRDDAVKEGERRRDLMKKMQKSPTLAQILSIGEKEGYNYGGKKEKKTTMKKKPIVPLVSDLLFKKKGSSTNSLYASSRPLY